MSIQKQLRRKDRIQVLTVSLIIGVTSALLVFFIDFGYPLSANERLTSGFIMGTFISLIYLTISIEILRKRKFRRIRYPYFVILSFLSLMMSTLFVHAIVGVISFRDYLFDQRSLMITILMSIGFATLVTLIDTIRQFSGKSVIRNVLLGRYYHAKQEDLVFLFIDLKSSTPLAEKLGSETFFKLLNEFHSTVEDCARFWGGTIYKYLGDGQIVIWPSNQADHSFQMILSLRNEFQELQGRAVGEYQYLKSFTAGLHRGPTLVGEIGNERREIGYWGDTVNTAQRIQSACKEHDTEILMSEEFFKILSPSIQRLVPSERILGVNLRGKTTPINLYKIDILNSPTAVNTFLNRKAEAE
jgi:adenylate cyclase